jgi:hypothetical protein
VSPQTMFTKQVSGPVDGLDSPSWPRRRNRSSDLEGRTWSRAESEFLCPSGSRSRSEKERGERENGLELGNAQTSGEYGVNRRSSAVSMYPDIHEATAMRIDQFTFGSIRIDGVTYEHDVVIARGRVRKRKKKSSKPFRDAFGHTPLSIEENIPWDCRRLVVGTGADGALPVMDEVKREAARRGVELLTVPTSEAIRPLQAEPKDTNAILHVTC